MPRAGRWEKWGDVGKGYKLELQIIISFGHLMYNIETTVNNTASFTRHFLRANFKYPHHTHPHTYTHKMVTVGCVNLIVVIVSQCIHISNHHIAH